MLLPHIYRTIGCIMLLPFAALFVATFHFDYAIPHFELSKELAQKLFFIINKPSIIEDFPNGLTDELATVGIIVSLFMIAFSKTKNEDEYVQQVRLHSLQIGVYIHYFIFILLTLTVYGGGYLSVVLYNIITVLVIFIIVFHYNIYLKPMLSKN